MSLTSKVFINQHALSSTPESRAKEQEGQQAAHATIYKESDSSAQGNKTEIQFHLSSNLYILEKQDATDTGGTLLLGVAKQQSQPSGQGRSRVTLKGVLTAAPPHPRKVEQILDCIFTCPMG